eukprot:952842-Prymnesium_polylepis.1
MVANPFGGVTSTVEGVVHRLDKLPGTDRTVYGDHSRPAASAPTTRLRGLPLGQPMQDGLSIADHAGPWT